MARKILVVGGTKFFGKKLVYQLLNHGDEVTVASRNFSQTDFGPEIKTIFINRADSNSIAQNLGNGEYDLIYDQICYSPIDAQHFCKIFDGRTQRVIHTSSQAVYLFNNLQKETDFEPLNYSIKMQPRESFDYAEGKRQAEAVYYQHARFPVTAVRFPFVLGPSDYTGRLDFHIQRIMRNQPMVIPNASAKISLIYSNEAADFLFWVGKQKIDTPINACSLGQTSLLDMIHLIEEETHSKATILAEGSAGDFSPYWRSHSRYLDTSQAIELGFEFLEIKDWLPPLIQAQYKTLATKA